MAETERDALLQVLDALEALQIPYMVAGSFASTFWGRPRMTHDADLVVEITEAEVSRLLFWLPDYRRNPLDRSCPIGSDPAPWRAQRRAGAGG